MKCELYCDNDCLDLPSLAFIYCTSDCGYIHRYMGHVILESMILCNTSDKLDIPNLAEDNIEYAKYRPFEFTADLQATSTFSFYSNYTLDAPALAEVIRWKSKYLRIE